MARSSLASVQLDVGEEPDELPRPDPDLPFRILVAGNFSGGAGRLRKAVAVDRDNFDQVMALLTPELRLELAGAAVPIRFREVDDFHPDALFDRLAPFAALRDLRRRLSDRATYAEAVAEIAPPAAAPASPVPDLSGADLLRDMMGEPPAAAAPAPARSDWDHMLHSLVAPYAEPKPDRRQAEWVAQTDAAITGQMRALLHHPDFQEMEAAWRGLFFLIRRLETSESLKVFVLDMPQEQLLSAEGLATLRRIAAEETTGTPGGTPWSVIAGLYEFAPEHETALLQIAAIARRAGAPFLAGVAPQVMSLSASLRRSPDARWIGLVLPRFLLRLPYGQATESTERFDFEEMPSLPEHQCYLWGNPSIACACLLGEAFTNSGWEMRPGEVNDIGGLPVHVYKTADGDSEMKPCAEVLLTEEAALLLLGRGFMPLASIKDSDRVRLVRFQSIAEPTARLAGRWE